MTDMTTKAKAGGISIHAVDVSRGIPAAGLKVPLRPISPDPRVVAGGSCAGTGPFAHPVAEA